MASLTQWTWVWVSSRSWCWTEKPGVRQSMGSQRVRHDWVTEQNWVIQEYQTGEIRTSRKGCLILQRPPWNREEKTGWRKRDSSQQPPCTIATLTHSHAVNFCPHLTISLQDIEVKFMQQRKKQNLECFSIQFFLLFYWEITNIHHRVSLRHIAWWFELLWNDYHNRFS